MPFATTNPATGQTEKVFPAHTPAEVDAILDRAVTAYAQYKTTSYAERARHLVTAAELLEGEVPDVARILTTEMGKTFAAAKAEVSKCALALRWFAEHGEALLADEVIGSSASKSYVHYQPIGPVLAVMPWNFPMWQVMRFAAPALMVGNVGLLKHASNVPQTALAIEDLFRRAGLPEGVFTNLFVESKDVAQIITDPRVVAVTLTGSERAGISVAENAGHALKKSVLELGGSDPFIVCPSADLDACVRTAVTARVQNNGQSCIAAKRFIVVDEVHDEFLARFTEAMDALVVGAVVHAGATVPDGDGWYFAPTVLSGITTDMEVAKEEVFGPVAMVLRVPDLAAALEAANATDFGLGSSVWTNVDDERARCIEGIEAGAVFVNAMVASTPELPFGGIKHSGFGRELSELGIKEFANAKTVYIA
jgi:succinate-semialdehyde dehydrogenase / glutarate-semialdehyde dehydrogenase